MSLHFHVTRKKLFYNVYWMFPLCVYSITIFTYFRFLYEDQESMSLVIKNVTPADAGVYQITASNELGEDTKEMHLIVKATPKIKKKMENQTCMVSKLPNFVTVLSTDSIL